MNGTAVGVGKHTNDGHTALDRDVVVLVLQRVRQPSRRRRGSDAAREALPLRRHASAASTVGSTTPRGRGHSRPPRHPQGGVTSTTVRRRRRCSEHARGCVCDQTLGKLLQHTQGHITSIIAHTSVDLPCAGACVTKGARPASSHCHGGSPLALSREAGAAAPAQPAPTRCLRQGHRRPGHWTRAWMRRCCVVRTAGSAQTACLRRHCWRRHPRLASAPVAAMCGRRWPQVQW